MNPVRAIKVASGVFAEKSMLSKIFDLSLNIIAPVKAKAHLQMHARRVLMNSGSLK